MPRVKRKRTYGSVAEDAIATAELLTADFFKHFPLPEALAESLRKQNCQIWHSSGAHLAEANQNRISSLLECVALCRSNMRSIYDASRFSSANQEETLNHSVAQSNGWSDADKLTELSHPKAHLLLITQLTSHLSPSVTPNGCAPPDPPEICFEVTHNCSSKMSSQGSARKALHAMETCLLGLIHLRFVIEAKRWPVLYLYELQLQTTLQKRGLGSALMEYINFIAQMAEMKRILCTVQTSNPGALRFYVTRCGFSLDASSPACPQGIWPGGVHSDEENTFEDAGYVILCKRIHKREKRLNANRKDIVYSQLS